jgi:hypothetical protein
MIASSHNPDSDMDTNSDAGMSVIMRMASPESRPVYLKRVRWGEPLLGPAQTADDLRERRYRYVHPSGETAFVVKADEARPFERGMAIVSENGRRGYVDTEGRVVWRER